jgi:hypothetical protein
MTKPFNLKISSLHIGAVINIKGLVCMYSFFVCVMFMSLLNVSFTYSVVLTGQLFFGQLWFTGMNYNVLYCDNPKYVGC